MYSQSDITGNDKLNLGRKSTPDHSILSPCQSMCPLHMDIREYIDLVAQGKIMEALQVIRNGNPFPSICAYVCTHPCEEACRRCQVDKPVAIRSLKRFAVEFGGDRMVQSEVATIHKEKIAIVGSGPAGLACAYYLKKSGYPVTIFEAHSEVGGMLRVGIPHYRLPREVLNNEVARLMHMGVEVRTNTQVVSLDLLFDMGYKAVFVTIGAQGSLRMGIKGEESPGVVDGITFLREVNLGLKPSLGERVAVVGGGNVAIDAARTAVRLGADNVAILYRRSENEMPADPQEVQQALEEGVDIKYQIVPTQIHRQNGQLSITCVKMELGEPDVDGRRKPAPIEGSDLVQNYDTLIMAIGQVPRTPEEFNIQVGRGSTIQVDPLTLTTNRPGVFAGGDVATGPATVTVAMAHGKRAASRIDEFIQHKYPAMGSVVNSSEVGQLLPDTIDVIRKIDRYDPATLPPESRTRDFQPIEQVYDWESAINEARRCLRCGTGAEILFQDKCASCLTCLRVCPYHVPYIDTNGIVCIPADQCQSCGICVVECPAKAIVMRKPLYRTQINEELEFALKSAVQSNIRPFIIGFCCQYGLSGTGTLANIWRGTNAGIWIVPVLCVAKIEASHMLRAFAEGAEGVFIAGCNEQCSRENTAYWIRQRIEKVRATLSQINLQPERISAFFPDTAGKNVTDEIDDFTAKIGGYYLESVIMQEVK